MLDEEKYTYEAILERMLDTIPDTIDKREGSIMYDALAPAAIELAQMYIELKYSIDLVFVDTAPGEYLDRLCKQIGITRKKATPAIKQAQFFDENNNLIDIQIGSRFTCEDFYWKVIQKISTGIYQIQCETFGIVGNNVTGNLIPVDYIDKLGTATLTELLIPGENEENDDTLRERYLSSSNNMAFAGNVQDYKEKTKAINGVGAVKVVPIWNGGGTVKLIILDSNYNKASKTLLDSVQQAICPSVSDAGFGLAPIGHKVTVETPEETEINVKTKVTLSSTEKLEETTNLIKIALEKYISGLRKEWEDSTSLIVRISQVESTILNVNGVLDIEDTTINLQTKNIEVLQDNIPVFSNLEVVEVMEVQET